MCNHLLPAPPPSRWAGQLPLQSRAPHTGDSRDTIKIDVLERPVGGRTGRRDQRVDGTPASLNRLQIASLLQNLNLTIHHVERRIRVSS